MKKGGGGWCLSFRLGIVCHARALRFSSLHGILSASSDIGSISFNTTKALPLKRKEFPTFNSEFVSIKITSEVSTSLHL